MKNLHLAIFGCNLASPGEHPALQSACRMFHALVRTGCRFTYYQPDLLGRRTLWRGRDPEGMRMVNYPAQGYIGLFECLEEAASADVIIKISGAGAFDHLLDVAALEVRKPGGIAVFMDLDPHATLDRVRRDPADQMLSAIPEYDLILAAGGSATLISAFLALGARECILLGSAPGSPVIHEQVQALKHALEVCLARRREPVTEVMAGVL